jgi:hypothetical protein
MQSRLTNHVLSPNLLTLFNWIIAAGISRQFRRQQFLLLEREQILEIPIRYLRSGFSLEFCFDENETNEYSSRAPVENKDEMTKL